MLGKKIETLKELEAACVFKRAVVCPNTYRDLKKPRPAAFVIHRPAIIVLKYIESGLYIYEKQHKDG